KGQPQWGHCAARRETVCPQSGHGWTRDGGFGSIAIETGPVDPSTVEVNPSALEVNPSAVDDGDDGEVAPARPGNRSTAAQ
ncbi:MAG TPA: hypothetical protein DD670_03900, partial [Planctomycetaceae bacterium]|nr:hypothetical protein [Planctomycetaceae bacterium]